MAKGISLNIGINSVDERFYEGSKRLASPENVAKLMTSIAAFEDFEQTHLLLTKEATTENLIKKLKEISEELKPGDYFLLTYCGHGSQDKNPSKNNNEVDGRNEYWCLYDKRLLDDELGKMLSAFAAGVRILIITDSCHSRTSVRDFNTYIKPNEVFNNNILTLLKNNPRTVFVYPRLVKEEIKASVIHISASKDNQNASDGDLFSKFTSLLLKHWNYGQFEGSYVDLINCINKQCGYSQKPAIGLLGNIEEQFIRSKPFKF